MKSKQKKEDPTLTQLGERSLRKLLVGRSEEAQTMLPRVRAYVQENRNTLEHCPFCSRNIKDREEALYLELMKSLYLVLKWCEERDRHEFTMKDVRHLLGQINYTRFGNLDKYGLIYIPDGAPKGHYGINRKTLREFFSGHRDIIIKRMVNLTTGQTCAETRAYLKDIPNLAQFMDSQGEFDHHSPSTPPEIVPSRRGLPTVEEAQTQKTLL